MSTVVERCYNSHKPGIKWWMTIFHFVFDTFTGREIAPKTGANATKFFTLATKS